MGPKLLVDSTRGDDGGAGRETAPWKTLAQAPRQLKPGETLCLRGIFHEKAAFSRSGTAAAPITIAAFPGELAVIDGGRREFAENPAASWQPVQPAALRRLRAAAATWTITER